MSRIALKQSQQLQLTPQLRQMIRLLQLSSTDLEQMIDEMVQENPLLEKSEIEEEPLSEQVTAAVSAPHRKNEYSIGGTDAVADIAAEENLFSFLHKQVCELAHDERQAQLLRVLIESLDDDGYLKIPLKEIIEHAPLEWMLGKKELQAALDCLHQFDPAGVGAADLQESLLLQLQRQSAGEETALAQKIVREHFDVLAQPGALSKLCRKLKKSDETRVQAALAQIQRLNPSPAGGFGGRESTVFVRPDLRVFRGGDGVWQVAAETHLTPKVEVCTEYVDAVRQSDDLVWNEKLEEAKTVTQSLVLRENTILRVARAIVAHQQDFFEFGAMALKPLSLAQIAQEVEIHESTVSRSVQNKYLICPGGLFELRYFLTQAVGQEGGETASAAAVKTYLEAWIQAEDAAQPFTDDVLREKLAAAGIIISRRTVAKYREELNIPAAYYRRKK